MKFKVCGTDVENLCSTRTTQEGNPSIVDYLSLSEFQFVCYIIIPPQLLIQVRYDKTNDC